MKGFAFIAALVFLGAGCVDVTVLDSSKTEVPSVSKTDFVEDARLSITRRTVIDATGMNDFDVFRLKKGAARLRLERPSRSDEATFLSVAGTYTSPTDKPEGFIVLDGVTQQSKERQGWNGAAFFRADGTVSIFETNNGKLLTRDYLKTVEKDGASLIQGHLLAVDGVAQNLAPQTPYQRRALCVFKDGSIAIVESKDLLDLQIFADSLVALGVKDAINLDMGQWSEGWYRDPISQEIRMIGYLTGATEKQSNWIVFADR